MSAATDETAPATSPVSRPSTPLTGKLGRYTIERELARGGMGVVYLAFDPELERRVALKLLASEDDESRARLLREARAMARLAHGNVVTVFDVGTIDGRDFVAMELMEGGTLADWLRSRPRRPREIVTAFLAAGRGLAAAHAAGLVHRDFKPSNVLRARDGRFAVTDFGLARDNSESTLPPKLRSDVHVVPRMPTALDDVTATGSILGTPQYMAPEQWENFNVTPATDQFAFCVSMWEAFAGKRPFDGHSAETLRDAVADASRTLDTAAVPRRVRRIIARGLAADPNDRWPSMDRLLAALERGERWRRRAFAATGGTLFTAAVAVAVAQLSGRSSVGLPCGGVEPRLAPAQVWTPERAAAVDRIRPTVEADLSAWQTMRDRACTDPTRHALALSCLDAVLARLDVVTQSATKLEPESQDFAGDWLVDPTVCAQTPPPRLVATWSPTARDALFDVLRLRFLRAEPGPPLPVSDADDACSRALVGLGRALRNVGMPAGDREFDQASDLAEACDERLVVDIKLAHVQTDDLGEASARDEARTRVAVGRVAQDDVYAQLDLLAARRAMEEHRYDDAISAANLGVERSTRRHRDGLRHAIELVGIEARARRNTKADIDYLDAHLPALTKAVVHMGLKLELQALAAELAWNRGELAASHALIKEAEANADGADSPGDMTAGLVVDRAGNPVAGATVVVDFDLELDSEGVLPFNNWPAKFTTDDRGRFTAPMAHGAVLLAIHGTERSLPLHYGSAPLRLQVAPTRQITGRVEGWNVARRPIVAAFVPGAQDVSFAAPVLPDGTFSLDGVPDVPVHLQVVEGLRDQGSTFTPVDARGAIAGLVLHLAPADRRLRVELEGATSASPAGGFVWIVPPQATMPETVGQVWALDKYTRDFVYLDKGKLEVNLDRLPHVPLLACAAGRFLGADGVPGEGRWFSDDKFRVTCERVELGRDHVVLKVRPTDR